MLKKDGCFRVSCHAIPAGQSFGLRYCLKTEMKTLCNWTWGFPERPDRKPAPQYTRPGNLAWRFPKAVEDKGGTDMEQNRLEAFEKMLSAVQEEYEGILSGMERMKAEKKTKTVTYQQLMARKLMYQNMLSMYQIYGLTSEQSGNLPGQPQAPEKESGWTCPECRRTFKKKGQSHYCGKAKENVDAYIAGQPEETQPYLQEIRHAISKALPDAEERISWSMPTFWKGHNLIQFAGFKKHIGLYPGPEAVEAFADRLEAYKTRKGTIQIPYTRPLPLELVAEIARWCDKA